MSAKPVQDGRRRAVIETVTPCVDGGAWPIKRTLGEEVVVQADIFTDGHDQLRCLLLYRSERETHWHEVPMTPLVNDRWQGRFQRARREARLYPGPGCQHGLAATLLSHQPDLNFDNPQVIKAVIRVMCQWLDMGVDGFRLDAIPYLCEREGTNNENLPETHQVIRQIRAVVDEH